MAEEPGPKPIVDRAEWMRLYQEPRHLELIYQILLVLLHYKQTDYERLSATEQEQLDVFVELFLYVMAQPDFALPAQCAETFLQQHVLIANLVAMSSSRTTDAAVTALLPQENHLAKLLILYSAHNTHRLPRQPFFDENAALASTWYNLFFHIFQSALASPNAWDHLRFHMQALDTRFVNLYAPHRTCFAATNIDPSQDHLLKRHLNQMLQQSIDGLGLQVLNRPRSGHIAVISGTWTKGHSVYRNQYHYLQRLAERYQLTLISAGARRAPETSLFDRVIELHMDRFPMDVSALLDNDFSMVYFTDIGMTEESMFLSNLRLAPIQAASYGHSVSTYGARIDYWIGGAEVELAQRARDNYSERLVLIPGLGITNVTIDFQPAGTPPRSDRFILNCCWQPGKINYPMLQLLQRVLAETGRDLLFRFYSGAGVDHDNSFIPFSRAVQRALGPEHVEIVTHSGYSRYLTMLEEGHLSLESYHFGGCNTVVDSLYVRQPVVCLQGEKWYNRIGSAIARRAGLEELVTQDGDAYVNLVSKLVLDAAYLERFQRKCHELDLDRILFDTSEAAGFVRAVDYLLAHHGELQQDSSGEPLTL